MYKLLLLTAFGLPFSLIQLQLSGNELSKSGVINSSVFPVSYAHVGQGDSDSYFTSSTSLSSEVYSLTSSDPPKPKPSSPM